MIRTLATVVFALLIAAPSVAQDRLYVPLGERYGPFGEKGVYELTNIISLQSTFGLSTQRDVTSTANGGTVGLSGGYLEVKADTQSGSTAALETVDRGQYQPGKGAEMGIGVRVVTAPTGDGVAEWGLGDGDNGAFFRLKSGGLCVVYERAGSESEACEGSFNGSLGGFNPTSEAGVYVIRFNWYGVGGAEWFVYEPNARSGGTLREHLVHSFVPANGQAMEDPNQYIFARVDNGATTTAVEIEVGGRRYDVQGKFKPPVRKTHARRTGVSVGTSYTPIICVRKEDPFPESGRQNSINAFFASFVPQVETEDITVVFAKVELADLTDANFVDPPDYDDGNTALEYDISSTAVSDFTILQGGFTFEAGATSGPNQGPKLGEDKTERVDIIRNTPTCALAKTDANTATVDATLRVTEEW
jgi:hypothetical protein